MDSKQFGDFIAILRKERGWTQTELADRLCVTNKAVSRWERGLGFPDIKTVKPLADALGVSIIELMQSEREQEKEVTQEKSAEIVEEVISLAIYQREIEKRNLAISVIIAIFILLIGFLICLVQWGPILFVCLPFIFFAASLILFTIFEK